LADRQGPVLIGEFLEAGLDEFLARHFTHGVEYVPISHATASNLNLDHALARGEKVKVEHGPASVLYRNGRSGHRFLALWTVWFEGSSASGRPRFEDLERRHRPVKALELKISQRTTLHHRFKLGKDPLADQDLPVRCFLAQSRRQVWNAADHRIVRAALEPD